MSKAIDVPLLIAEVKKRPPIWDGRQKVRQRVPNLWHEVAENVGVDVEKCKRKWKNLRDAYHAEIRRNERRLQEDKLMGLYDPNITSYKSKWIYFTSLTFLNNDKKFDEALMDNESNNYSPYENNPLDESCNVLNVADIKLEPSQDMDYSHDFKEDEEEDAASDLLFQEFKNIATPQAARRLSATFAMNNEKEQTTPSVTTPSNTNPTDGKVPECQCPKRSDEQVHFLQDLGKEEQALMKSTNQDISRCNKLDHIGDFDYNFLVSFLPQMKRMTELQNLQFRTKMCETALNLLSSSNDPNASQNQSTNCQFK